MWAVVTQTHRTKGIFYSVKTVIKPKNWIQYISLAIKLSADQHGFEIKRHTSEIVGICQACLDKPKKLESKL